MLRVVSEMHKGSSFNNKKIRAFDWICRRFRFYNKNKNKNKFFKNVSVDLADAFQISFSYEIYSVDIANAM